MLCTGRILAASNSWTPFLYYSSPLNDFRKCHRGKLKFDLKWRRLASDPDAYSFASSTDTESSSDENAAGFCIIEGPETVQDFAKMELQEIRDNIRSRRNKIFLHMEEVPYTSSKVFRSCTFSQEIYQEIFEAEDNSTRIGAYYHCVLNKLGRLLCDHVLHRESVRRLRIQQRIRSAEMGILSEKQENELPNFPSFIPFLPPLNPGNLKVYYASCFSLIAGIMIFGGLLAPTLELKLGLGGTSYADFIHSMHLPMQLSQVDPIVASFSGGAVGVISSLMVVEINNVKQQEHKRCKYCLGTGYLACARCSSTGALILIEPVSTVIGGNQPLSPPKSERCPNCSGSGKVMCPTCLCTGMAMASEHDPRIDPFD